MRLLRPIALVALLLGALAFSTGADCDPFGEIDHDGDEMVLNM